MSDQTTIETIIDTLNGGVCASIAEIMPAAVAAADTELCVACALGDAARAERLLESGPDAANAPTGPRGFAPLLYAAYSRIHHCIPERAEQVAAVAGLLLARGADAGAHHFVDWAPTSPLPALYAAAGEANNPLLVRLLLEAGADPNDGESIYHAAEHNYRECLELLAAYGGDVGARHPHWENTPLYFLFGYRPGDTNWETARHGVRVLLELGADPNVTSYAIAETALHLAVRNGHMRETLELLLAFGADPSFQRADGRTPFQLAVRLGNDDAVRLFSDLGIVDDIMIGDRFVGALMMHDEDTVRAMLNDDPGLVRIMNDEDRAMIVSAAVLNRTEAVRLMLSVGFDIATRGEAGATALHHAAWRGHRRLAGMLLERDAPLDVRCTAYGGTPLDWAAHGSSNCRAAGAEEYVAIVEAMVAAGADPAGTSVEMASPEVAATLLRLRG